MHPIHENSYYDATLKPKTASWLILYRAICGPIFIHNLNDNKERELGPDKYWEEWKPDSLTISLLINAQPLRWRTDEITANLWVPVWCRPQRCGWTAKPYLEVWSRLGSLHTLSQHHGKVAQLWRWCRSVAVRKHLCPQHWTTMCVTTSLSTTVSTTILHCCLL